MSTERDPSKVSHEVPAVSYGGEAFARAVTELEQRYEAGKGVRVVFAGGAHAMHQQALADLAEQTVTNVHQFELPSLVGERRMQTQNSLRKAFDAAAEEGALLFFDEVDMLFNWHHPDSMGGEEEPTSIEYFFQRVEAFGGIIVLGLNDPKHVEAAREYEVQLIVEFA